MVLEAVNQKLTIHQVAAPSVSFRYLTINYWCFVDFLCRHIHEIAKSDCYLCHICLSTGNNLAPIAQIFMKFNISVFFGNMLQKFKFHKIWQEQQVLYIKTILHLWLYLAQFFLEWGIFQTKVAEKIKTHITCSMTLSLSLFFFFFSR